VFNELVEAEVAFLRSRGAEIDFYASLPEEWPATLVAAQESIAKAIGDPEFAERLVLIVWPQKPIAIPENATVTIQNKTYIIVGGKLDPWVGVAADLHRLLLATFPSQTTLARACKEHLDITLATLPGAGDTFSSNGAAVMKWANDRQKMHLLISMIQKALA
jgi:hypothetical protein